MAISARETGTIHMQELKFSFTSPLLLLNIKSCY